MHAGAEIPSVPRVALAWLAIWSAIAASLAVVAGLGPLPDHEFASISAMLAGGIAWIAAAIRARTRSLGVVAIVTGATALRVLALTADPRTSDDVYRYVWEGRVVLDGASPYSYAPDSPEAAPLRAAHADLFARVNHPSVSAAYPPGTEYACAAIVRIADGFGARDEPHATERAVFALRVAFALADLALLAPLAALLARRRLAKSLLVIWAWSPLVALEFAGAAHFDALGIALWIAALALFERPIRSGMLFALAVSIKFLPIATLAFATRTRRTFAMLAAFAAMLAIPYVAAMKLDGGADGLTRGISEYAFRWETQNLVHHFVEGFFGRFASYDESWHDPRRLARAVELSLWIGWAIVLVRRRVDPLEASGRMVGAFLVLTPTLHPWYLTWMIPFLALRPRTSWLALIALAPLCYAPLEGWIRRGVWSEPAWLWPVLALPFFALRIREAIVERSASS